MKISILTATYNRAILLPQLYESLKDNLKYEVDFEWLIMDDGSTDETRDVVEKFCREKLIDIKYYYQENQGKMAAINKLVEFSTGDFIIDCDSDDYFAKNAFGIIKQYIDKLVFDQELYALLFLKCDVAGEISGKKFAENQYKTTMFDLYFKEDIQGEKIILFNANIRKRFKHRIESGEKFVTEARMYHEMDKQYKVLGINEPIIIGNYKSDGYTKNINKILIENPKGFLKYFEEVLNFDTDEILFDKRLYAIKHYILFSYLTKNKHIIKHIKGKLNKFLIALLYVPGAIKTKLTIKHPDKKIFISSWTLEVGGIETALVNLVNALSDNYKVTLALENIQGEFADKINDKVEIIEYTPSKSKNIIERKFVNFINRIKFIAKHRNKYNLAISFATYSRPGSFMARVAAKNNALWVHTNYKVLYQNNRQEIIKFFKSIRYNKFRKIICISEDAKQAFEDVFPNFKREIQVINNLVNYKEILEKAEEPISLKISNYCTFLSVCRHEEKAKKLTRIIEAVNLIRLEGYRCKVLLVGEGKDTEMYKKLVKDMNLEDYIVFCGMQKNPYPYFKISDCIILTSEYEGYPVVYTEAKVLNKPIITTAVSDSLLDVQGKYGVVTDKNVKDIKDAMINFIQNGYEIKEKFDSEEFNKSILQKIEKLI